MSSTVFCVINCQLLWRAVAVRVCSTRLCSNASVLIMQWHLTKCQAIILRVVCNTVVCRAKSHRITIDCIMLLFSVRSGRRQRIMRKSACACYHGRVSVRWVCSLASSLDWHGGSIRGTSWNLSPISSHTARAWQCSPTLFWRNRCVQQVEWFKHIIL